MQHFYEMSTPTLELRISYYKVVLYFFVFANSWLYHLKKTQTNLQVHLTPNTRMLAFSVKELACFALGAAILSMVNYGVPASASVFDGQAASAKDCNGTITIGTEFLNNRGRPILKISSVEEVVTTGNCCWKLYELRIFNRSNATAKSHVIRPPHSSLLPDHVDWNPKSVRKTKCWNSKQMCHQRDPYL